jgi:hypothetical protein
MKYFSVWGNTKKINDTMENVLIVHPENEDQQKALQVILDGFQIPYEQEPEMDETERILANPVMAKRLDGSIQNINEGNTTAIKIEDLWK